MEQKIDFEKMRGLAPAIVQDASNGDVLMHLGAVNKTFITAMRERGILVRDRSNDPGCKDCVRITVGAAEHNDRLMKTLREVFEQIGLQEKVAK